MKNLTFKQMLILGSGTCLELYDSYVFAFLMLPISLAFFPKNIHNDIFGILGFSILFIVRPLSGFFWGILGDRKGKIFAFKHSILLMALATLFIGIMPTFNTIGWLAPILMLFFRAIQGFSISGELGSSVVLCYEQSQNDLRFKNSSLLFAFIYSGMLLANLIIYGSRHLNNAEMIWRIPFIFDGITGIIVYFIRKTLHLSEKTYPEVNLKFIFINYNSRFYAISSHLYET